VAVHGELRADLLAIYFSGTDFFGRKFEIALDPQDAKNLLFRLHRIIMEQEEMRLAVNRAHDGGKRA
jgi:hypothetical protein